MVEKMAAILFFDHWKTELQDVRYSNVVGFQAHTVKATLCSLYATKQLILKGDLNKLKMQRYSLQLLCSKCVLNSALKKTNKGGSENQRPFEYQKHLNTERFKVRISNDSVFKWSVYMLCPMH